MVQFLQRLPVWYISVKIAKWRGQGFPNSIKGWRGIPSSGGNRKSCFGKFFYWVVGIWGWSFRAFSELKTTFKKYWKLIKIKISMICMYKEYEVQIKIVQAMAIVWGESTEGYFSRWVGQANFWLVGGLFPICLHLLPVGKTSWGVGRPINLFDKILLINLIVKLDAYNIFELVKPKTRLN